MRAIGAFYFFYFATIGAYLVYTPHLLSELGYSAWQIGVIFALNPLMRFLSPFLFLRTFRLTTELFFASVAATALLVWGMLWTVSSFWLLLVHTVMLGFFWSLQLPFVDAKAVSLLSRTVYGRVRILGSVGFIAVVLGMGQMTLDTQWIVGIIGATSFLAAVAAFVMIDARDRALDGSARSEKASLVDAGLWHWPFWLSLILMQVSFGAFYNFFTIYEIEHGIPQQTVSWLWTTGVVAEILMLGWQKPWLRFDLMGLMKLSTGLTVFRWLILWVAPSSVAASFAAQALHAFSFGLYHVTTLAILSSLATQMRLAQQFYYGLAFGLGGFVGALLFGLLYGPQLFLYAALLAAAALGMLYIKGTSNNPLGDFEA